MKTLLAALPLALLVFAPSCTVNLPAEDGSYDDDTQVLYIEDHQPERQRKVANSQRKNDNRAAKQERKTSKRNKR